MSLAVAFRRAARAEFDAAADRYELLRPGLGTEFVNEIDACIARAARQPLAYARVRGEVRRVNASRFPFSVYFLPEAERVVVLSVFHGSRDPAVWQGRV